MHVIARQGWFRCETQVRTLTQHRWAELFESVCDAWGREPRYGEPLQNPCAPFRDGARGTRAEFLELLWRTGRIGESVERALVLVEQTRSSLLATDATLGAAEAQTPHQRSLLLGPCAPEAATAIRQGMAVSEAALAKARLSYEHASAQHQRARDSYLQAVTALEGTLGERGKILEGRPLT